MQLQIWCGNMLFNNHNYFKLSQYELWKCNFKSNLATCLNDCKPLRIVSVWVMKMQLQIWCGNMLLIIINHFKLYRYELYCSTNRTLYSKIFTSKVFFFEIWIQTRKTILTEITQMQTKRKESEQYSYSLLEDTVKFVTVDPRYSVDSIYKLSKSTVNNQFVLYYVQ